MEPKLLKTKRDYKAAIKELERIDNTPDFEDNPALIDKSELLEHLIELYESEHYPIKKGDPIEIIKLKMEYMGLKQKDLIPYIGSKGLVSEVLNKNRKLSKSMIRKLSEFLKIEQKILNVDETKPKFNIRKNRLKSVTVSLRKQSYIKVIKSGSGT